MGWSPAIAAAGNPDRAEALARTITQPDYQAEARPRFPRLAPGFRAGRSSLRSGTGCLLPFLAGSGVGGGEPACSGGGRCATRVPRVRPGLVPSHYCWRARRGSVRPRRARLGLAVGAVPGSVSGGLTGVATTSARNAWAVGGTSRGKTLILRWNGTMWRQVPSPSPAGNPALSGVAATSAGNAWAVGSYQSGIVFRTLILRWNGTAWKQVPSPTPAGGVQGTELSGVAAVSSRNAWAVGSTVAQAPKTVILHWNGTRWQRVPSPTPAGGGLLAGVAATSAHDAWAVGVTAAGKTLILRWNGAAWQRVPSPSPGPAFAQLTGVAAVSARDAWAVGFTSGHEPIGTVILHWNGTRWRRVPSPSPAAHPLLEGVAAVSARDAWAVGDDASSTINTLILRWNGTAWKQVPSPSPPPIAQLFGVAAVSATRAWAVGFTNGRTLITTWNGTHWK